MDANKLQKNNWYLVTSGQPRHLEFNVQWVILV